VLPIIILSECRRGAKQSAGTIKNARQKAAQEADLLLLAISLMSTSQHQQHNKLAAEIQIGMVRPLLTWNTKGKERAELVEGGEKDPWQLQPRFLFGWVVALSKNEMRRKISLRPFNNNAPCWARSAETTMMVSSVQTASDWVEVS